MSYHVVSVAKTDGGHNYNYILYPGGGRCFFTLATYLRLIVESPPGEGFIKNLLLSGLAKELLAGV